jgi:DNA repair exonuclease SbcCD ATPase subunit
MTEEAHNLREQLKESETRRREATSTRFDGPKSLRESEDRFMIEERLRDDLERARRAKLSLEAALLDRDARAMEHHFDLEAKDDEIDRLKRRVKELELAYNTATSIIPSTFGAGGTGMISTGSKKPGATTLAGKSKREEELEGAVEAMKRVVDKMRGENDRLRRGGVQEDDRKGGEAEKRAAQEKKRADKLEVEIKELHSKLKANEDGNQKLVQRQQMIANLRKQLKTKEDEVGTIREQLDRVTVEREDLQRRLAAAENRVQQLEVNLQHAARTGPTQAPTTAGRNPQQESIALQQREISELKKRMTELSVENETLRQQARTAVVAASTGSGLGTSAKAAPKAAAQSSETAGNDRTSEECRRLRTENDRLRNELSAFDMEFFEEIENLKFSYAEAVRENKMLRNLCATNRIRVPL